MSAPIIRGDSSVHDHHTGGRITNAEQRTRIYVLQGRYSELEAQMPKRNGRFRGFRVESSELVRAKGGMGLLTVTCRVKGGGASGNPSGNIEETVYEVEMAQLEKPLLSKPGWDGYAEQIEAWRGSDPAMRAAYKYTDAEGEEAELLGNARKIAKLLMKGVESYLVFAPVVRVTRRSNEEPKDTSEFRQIGKDCGKRCSPPSDPLSLVAGSWEWLKTADRCQEVAGGSFERVEEWTGADEWDEDLYDEA